MHALHVIWESPNPEDVFELTSALAMGNGSAHLSFHIFLFCILGDRSAIWPQKLRHSTCLSTVSLSLYSPHSSANPGSK